MQTWDYFGLFIEKCLRKCYIVTLTLFEPGFSWLSVTGGGGGGRVDSTPPPEHNVTIELGQ